MLLFQIIKTFFNYFYYFTSINSFTTSGEIINNISITDDGGVIVETENDKKKFYTHNQQDIIDNVEDYSADYIICMIQDEDGISVSKY
jgi:hypothetical protein